MFRLPKWSWFVPLLGIALIVFGLNIDTFFLEVVQPVGVAQMDTLPVNDSGLNICDSVIVKPAIEGQTNAVGHLVVVDMNERLTNEQVLACVPESLGCTLLAPVIDGATASAYSIGQYVTSPRNKCQ